MKHIQNIFLLIALLGVFSCTREELPGGDTDSKGRRLMITADDITQAKTRATTEEGTEDERSYSELHLYCFKADGTPLHHTVVNTAGVYPYFLSLPAVIETAGAVDYYVFASPVGTTMPGANATVNELTALLTDGMAGGNPLAMQYTADRKIPMSGSVTGHDFSNQTSLTIPLTRTVSKLRVRIVNKIDAAAGITLYPEEIETQVKNLRSQAGYFWSAANPAAPALFESQWLTMADRKEAANTYNWVYGYINEHLFDEATPPANRAILMLRVPFTKGAAPKSVYTYEVPLDFQFKRNFIYQLTVDVYGPGKEDVKVTIDCLPWNVEDKEFDSKKTFTLSNEEFVTYSDVVTNETAVLVTSAWGATTDKGTITVDPATITVSRSDFPMGTTPTEVKVTMPIDVTAGTLSFTFDGETKTVKLLKKNVATAVTTLYSIPETSTLPAGNTVTQIVSGGDWLETGGQTLETKSCALGTDRSASVIVTDGAVHTLYNLTQKAIQSDFGFKNCERNVSRESERWTIKLSGGVYKANADVQVRLVIDDTKESLSTAETGDATISIDAATSEGSASYTKKRWDNEQNNAANNGSRTVRLQIKAPSSADWENLAETGIMHDRNTWWNNNMYGRKAYHSNGSSAKTTIIDPIVKDYNEVHANHPYFGKTKWKVPGDHSSSTTCALYLIWDCVNSTPKIYKIDASTWAGLCSGNYDDTRYVVYYTRASGPSLGGTTWGDRKWENYGVNIVATVPVKENLIRPTDIAPITEP